MRVHDRAGVLGVHLASRSGRELRIGALTRDAGGTVTFNVDDAYLALGPGRPLVSMAWRGRNEEETIARLMSRSDKLMHGGLLPPFFDNLLPEGALRELVAKEFGSGAFDNFDVLARLGGDLPGAVVARIEAGSAGRVPVAGKDANPAPAKVEVPETPPLTVRFSLAGIQLKFSMSLDRGSITIPASGHGGEVILKTPSPTYRDLPEVEHTALRLAAAAGVNVVDSWLVTADEVDGVPPEFLAAGPVSLVVRRFDRTDDGGRIQMEDFAQIFGAIGNQKYSAANDATVMNAVQRFASDGRGDLLESLRRVVVNLLLGNGDCHLKNWSFLYPEDGRVALTPAYDLVPTFIYGDTSMALSFGGTHNATIVGLKRFERLAGLLKIDDRVILREVRRTVEQALDLWPGLLPDLPAPESAGRAILERLPTLRLVKEIRPSWVPGGTLEGTNEPDEQEVGGFRM